MLFILADNFETARRYAIDTGAGDWRFIFSALTLKGHRPPINYVKAGKWWQREDREDIENILEALDAKEVPI